MTIAAASGPAGMFQFEDMPLWNDDYSEEYEGAWYYDAVYALQGMGVVEGSDGYYYPNTNVNRAEMGVMLYRLYEYIDNPMGDEWDEFSNTYYTVWYPSSEYEYSSLGTCSSALDVSYDYLWGIDCYDANDSMEDVIAEMGDQFNDTGTRRESRETFTLNGFDATRVVVTTLDIPSWYYEVIFVEDSDGAFYTISNGAIPNPDFEFFYRSFQLN